MPARSGPPTRRPCARGARSIAVAQYHACTAAVAEFPEFVMPEPMTMEPAESVAPLTELVVRKPAVAELVVAKATVGELVAMKMSVPELAETETAVAKLMMAKATS